MELLTLMGRIVRLVWGWRTRPLDVLILVVFGPWAVWVEYVAWRRTSCAEWEARDDEIHDNP